MHYCSNDNQSMCKAGRNSFDNYNKTVVLIMENKIPIILFNTHFKQTCPIYTYPINAVLFKSTNIIQWIS